VSSTPGQATSSERPVYTIGHSTHELERFVSLLRAYDVELLVDVRRYPKSRRVPQFNDDSLPSALNPAGIEYLHEEPLGGRRKPRRDSVNEGWQNAGFRGYADHLTSDEFRAALACLEELAAARTSAVMCAEARWTQCHRRLLSDALVARGKRVLHIGSDGRTEPHELTPFAVVEADGTLSYPASQTSLDL
jgi:uncharacterized protein (DUF488 family)